MRPVPCAILPEQHASRVAPHHELFICAIESHLQLFIYFLNLACVGDGEGRAFERG